MTDYDQLLTNVIDSLLKYQAALRDEPKSGLEEPTMTINILAKIFGEDLYKDSHKLEEKSKLWSELN